MVLTDLAVDTILEVAGVRRRVSQMIRTGFLPSGRRQVRRGSSLRMVPTPAIMAL